MRVACGDRGVKFKKGNRFELFISKSCPEPKYCLMEHNDATFANCFSPKSIEGGNGVMIDMDLVKKNP